MWRRSIPWRGAVLQEHIVKWEVKFRLSRRMGDGCRSGCSFTSLQHTRKAAWKYQVQGTSYSVES